MSESSDKITVYINPELEEIVPRFIELRHEDISAIRAALEKKDFGIIARIGHSMKGSGAGYGFNPISDIGRKLEEAAKVHDDSKVKQLTLELSAYIENIHIVYEK